MKEDQRVVSPLIGKSIPVPGDSIAIDKRVFRNLFYRTASP